MFKISCKIPHQEQNVGFKKDLDIAWFDNSNRDWRNSRKISEINHNLITDKNIPEFVWFEDFKRKDLLRTFLSNIWNKYPEFNFPEAGQDNQDVNDIGYARLSNI